jgi:hypothetical protein
LGSQPGKIGRPKRPAQWRGCGKFKRRFWRRSSHQQTEFAYLGHGYCFFEDNLKAVIALQWLYS